MRIVVTILALTFLLTGLKAQELLRPADAVGIALKNNYDILVATNNAEIARINNSAGNAGMLPQVGITSTDSYSVEQVDQKLSSGVENKYGNSGSNTFNTGLELSWTLFDGGKMFITKSKLGEIETLGQLEFRDQVLQTVYEITVAYFEVVREKQQLLSINEAIRKYQDIVTILRTSFEAGLAPKTNLLQAQIDLNVYRESAINQQTAIIASKRELNQLLSRDANTDFEVIDSIHLETMPGKEELISMLFEKNTSINILSKQVDIADLGLKENKTALLPKLRFNAGYSYFQADNTAGSMLMNRNYGPQIGGTLTIPIYQAGNASRQIRTARIQLESTRYNLENTKLQVSSELQNTITTYENQLQLLEIEKSNSELAKANLEIVVERLRLGQTTSLELHQAQESYVDSQTRLINFEYYLKVAETRLKKLLAGL